MRRADRSALLEGRYPSDWSGVIRSSGSFTAEPDAKGSARALSRIGYSLSEALSDIVDNCIDAGASEVQICFVRDADAVRRVSIADNGNGLTQQQLYKAMRFAVQTEHYSTDLGTFGIGMKSASLSQCKTFSLIGKVDGDVNGCQWSTESIGENWRCDIITQVDATAAFEDAFVRSEAPVTGAVLVWERLDRLRVPTHAGDLDVFLSQTISELELSLGITYHRFLTTGQVKITLISKNDAIDVAIPRVIRGVDPFEYPKSGLPGYPCVFKADLADGTELCLEAHVWPAGAQTNAFTFGRLRGSKKHGFYFYRNDRLIQVGGWNGVAADDDATLSLARVRVDLPPGSGQTNIQKTEVQLSESLSQSLARASFNGISLLDYLEAARAYSSSSQRAPRSAAAIQVTLGKGVPVSLQRRYKASLGSAVTREISFSWQQLGNNRLFELNRVDGEIQLNANLRHLILDRSSASGTDATLVKTLLFLLVEKELERIRSSAKSEVWLERCQSTLMAAIESLRK